MTIPPIDHARRMLVLTDGHSNPITAKTACSVLRDCPDEVVAVLDAAAAGKTAAELLGVGVRYPLLPTLDQPPMRIRF